jgi:hypothetical protein
LTWERNDVKPIRRYLYGTTNASQITRDKALGRNELQTDPSGSCLHRRCDGKSVGPQGKTDKISVQETIVMKSKDLKRAAPAKRVLLRRALNKNKKIKKTVKQAASELISINEVLRQCIKVNIPVRAVEEAIIQIEGVAHEVAGAANDLHQVNIALVQELAERVVIVTCSPFSVPA